MFIDFPDMQRRKGQKQISEHREAESGRRRTQQRPEKGKLFNDVPTLCV